ncbi:hypothetical protein BJ322DRAFT_1104984 [Thelephora terrestris]|uniref:DUF6532 domain-containing protein n=1 Tax=Thelephora terrestris TaxID=56493 RepID=A0A9P6HP34_9AGAM|nr:hypothetical protein BJ322DRAFT_1104984 [Thelephora terrestris]
MILQGDLFAHPILEKLCRSFYEEEKWKQALKQSNPSEDSEWLASVTVVMVAFAATAYQAALEEWQSGNYVQRKFDCLKTLPAYTEIHDHIVDRLENDPYSGDASDRFSSWACESDFVQVVLDGLGVPPADDD